MLQVPAAVGDEPPDGAEEEPGECVGEDEEEQAEAPLQVHQSGEQVRQVAVRLAHVALLHVAPAVLLHVSLAAATPRWLLGASGEGGVLLCHGGDCCGGGSTIGHGQGRGQRPQARRGLRRRRPPPLARLLGGLGLVTPTGT